MTQCISNNKQIALALILYADEHNDMLPLCRDWASLGGQTGQAEPQENIKKPFRITRNGSKARYGPFSRVLHDFGGVYPAFLTDS